MQFCLFAAVLALLWRLAAATPLIQGDCVENYQGLKWLVSRLSDNAAISCLGSALQQYNAGRYWGEQFGKNASVVVYPANTKDVKRAVRATVMSPLGANYAFVSGAHGMTNASSSYDFVIDLSYLNATTVIPNYEVDGENITVIAYQGGATWKQIIDDINGSGYTAVGARDSTVGAGGFSTGGGIGFLAGALGYAIDRLRALEVVLPDGTIVHATKHNKHSDLFWALQGGGGQFGIVTTFYQEAAPEPTLATLAVYYLDNDSIDQSFENTVNFFQNHQDPYSLMYYGMAYLPADPSNPNAPPSTYAIRNVVICVYFTDRGADSTQVSYNVTFAPLLQGLKSTFNTTYAVPYADATEVIDAFFPYGFRRGFFGPQTTNISVSYLQSIQSVYNAHINALLARGEFPATDLWALQYMLPGLNGFAPTSDKETGWLHSIVGHQTLFSPAWASSTDDSIVSNTTTALNNITYANQASIGPFIADYPNYISPGASGCRVWGDNVQRLIEVKEKYDPGCLIHNGRVFATEACIRLGFANIYPTGGC